MKTCTKCFKTKELKDFGTRTTPDGLQYSCKACVHEYYLANRTKLSQNSKDRHQKNKQDPLYNKIRRERVKKYGKTRRGMFAQLKHKAKIKGITLEICLEEFLNFKHDNCFYCLGSLPKFGYGLDRKDSKRGYAADNIVPCCTTCNKMKNDILSHEEMVIAMRAVLDYRRQNGKG